MLQNKHARFNLYRNIKELTRRPEYKQTILVDEKRHTIMDTENKLVVWENYKEQLFNDKPDKIDNEYFVEKTEPEITESEVKYTIKEMKTGKAVGPDEIPIEILQVIVDCNIHVIVELFSIMYRTGILPKEWLLSTSVTIPKKKNARQCCDYRTISLMCHILKVFLKIIHRRIY
ncbi:uncharacterized protein [Diabrotica undecimpunctata]|uniref:uncharacterized protein n=1 Tax=Diabrotica undecimpunctata TaxID=50387 RepID=UPI003B637BA0